MIIASLHPNRKPKTELINPTNICYVEYIKPYDVNSYAFVIRFNSGDTRRFEFATLEEAEQEFRAIEAILDRSI